MDEQELKELLYRYENNAVTEQERALIESWYLQHRENDLPEYTMEERMEDAEAVWAGLHQPNNNKKIVRLLLRIAAAASLLIICTFGGYRILHNKSTAIKVAKNRTNDVAPGGNKAILTLANGQKIYINDAKKGVITHQAGIKVTKNKNGQIVYLVSHANDADGTSDDVNVALAYNTLSTPRGGQSSVTLSDGTVAYLDAGSSIKFPVLFHGNERRVAVTGQVYFDVVHNAAKPFRVDVKGQTIEDIGTSFNINAYDDEPVIKTTLLSGSIKISKGNKSATLVPGQQAVTLLSMDAIHVKDVDTEEAKAWKEGYFLFNNEKLESVMRKISRWYDVDVVYPDDQKLDVEYWGSITRYGNVSKVLNMLQITGDVRFRIDGKKIIVSKK
ncbi:FecR family protein [Mucilaginibacter sp. X4EP1]|uniref:FecR family protein n=1 Tax=Mucilaginibacter sp. X4EP1 TaxID=2723092 RepID=UPI002167D87B|nr:FecR family protein [Mucilaginibacter sp. X4EP1]MCS3814608.1 ferric-dicitrate binding protein FerR (iron transport regulator) [Mucilaginibacter sp. X4EP1]